MAGSLLLLPLFFWPDEKKKTALGTARYAPGFKPWKGTGFSIHPILCGSLYLNPALTGISQETRMGTVYRKQWPGLDYQFTAFTAYLDHYSFDQKSGVGLSVSSFSEEFLKLNTTDISGFYAYNLQLSERVALQVGTQVSYIQKRGTLENLLFGDQIDVFNQALFPSSADAVGGLEPFSYFSIGLGGVLTWNKLWIGISGHHLNRPNLAFICARWANAALAQVLPTSRLYHSLR
jgi:type IX secretion system PorP/SprF family membrane protein